MEGWQYKLAFVIQFRPETDIEVGRFEGRVEHILSCKATRFHSLDELLAFLSRAMTEVGSSEQLSYETVLVPDAVALTDSCEGIGNVRPEQC
jgi:hypothetical protein